MPAFDQSTYQVRMEWGVAGLARLAPADIVVVVDVLGFGATVLSALERGETHPLDAAADALPPSAVAEAAAAGGAVVLLGGLRNAAAVAAAVLAEQERRGARTSVAVIAAGEPAGPDAESGEPAGRDAAAPLRFTVEDQLGAGAVIAALGDLGIDHSSPEAAVAAEGFRALRRAVTHLLTASGSGQELIARRERETIAHAAAVDAASVVPVLRGTAFVAQ